MLVSYLTADETSSAVPVRGCASALHFGDWDQGCAWRGTDTVLRCSSILAPVDNALRGETCHVFVWGLVSVYSKNASLAALEYISGALERCILGASFAHCIYIPFLGRKDMKDISSREGPLAASLDYESSIMQH